MRYSSLAVCLLFLCAVVARSGLADPAQPAEAPAHERAVTLLRAGTGVIPASPAGHPVSTMYNREAVIPPQCYTRTEGVHNPCYVCHQDQVPGRENAMNDAALQVAYSFSEPGMTNHWKNLFEDRSERVAAIADHEILTWIAEDNYSELSGRLTEAEFRGWVPDLRGLQEGAAAFDDEGFARDGSHWVAFNYKPMPSTFWPTNGATDDVMIRLPVPFRRDASGAYSRDIYRANLAIVEALIKGMSAITTAPLDEHVVGRDLDGDGALGTATRITRLDSYVGAAESQFAVPSLYPLGTEFLHTVRYLGFDEHGDIVPSRRIREVRYMQKRNLLPVAALAQSYREEQYAKDQGYLPGFINLGQRGLDNEQGWVLGGFIEDRQGRLRANTFEENMFCMGCHTSIGATIDKTFSFARKIDGAPGWGYIDLRGMPDAPNLGEQRGEIATYFERAGGGGEFRSNPEMAARWFQDDGSVDHARVSQARDVYELITPSRARALELNKAYRVIVEDQDYIYGRDATVRPPRNVYERIDNVSAPTLPPDRAYRWDLRLNWDAVTTTSSTTARLPAGSEGAVAQQ